MEGNIRMDLNVIANGPGGTWHRLVPSPSL